MARLSISESARQAGCSRQYLHKLIKAGTLSSSKDENDQPYIDDSELLRVFDGRLPRQTPITAVTRNRDSNEHHTITGTNTRPITGLQPLVEVLQEQLQRAETREKEQREEFLERERRLLDQVDKLTDTIKQIEHKTPAAEPVNDYRPSWIVRVLTKRIW
jgi:hypothetical protein